MEIALIVSQRTDESALTTRRRDPERGCAGSLDDGRLPVVRRPHAPRSPSEKAPRTARVMMFPGIVCVLRLRRACARARPAEPPGAVLVNSAGAARPNSTVIASRSFVQRPVRESRDHRRERRVHGEITNLWGRLRLRGTRAWQCSRTRPVRVNSRHPGASMHDSLHRRERCWHEPCGGWRTRQTAVCPARQQALVRARTATTRRENWSDLGRRVSIREASPPTASRERNQRVCRTELHEC
jgi:hypothetical protein